MRPRTTTLPLLAILAAASFSAAPLRSQDGPGPAAAWFLRGDSNSDGDVDISDAVRTLLFLFAGGAPPACEDASDSDDDGSLSITDVIHLLNHLFRGGEAPPAPGPSYCGRDRTEDALSCESHGPCELPGIAIELRPETAAVFKVTDPADPLSGFKLEAPRGAVPQETRIFLSLEAEPPDPQPGLMRLAGPAVRLEPAVRF
ncbi:MAG: hypothetical protein HY721_33590, partial [Planctomycetes bacterium]|nr:hypothetical protein [Planctomycetota bacterium]